MSLFKKIRKRQDRALFAEEKLYEYVAKEIAAGEIRQGLWAKAESQAVTSSDADVKRKYIELRVELLGAEGRLQELFLEEDRAAVNAISKVDSSESTIISEATVEGVRQEIEVGSIHPELWKKAKAETKGADGTATHDRYIELRLQYLKSRFNCPFCLHIMNEYGRCPKCGNTVDKWALEARSTNMDINE